LNLYLDTSALIKRYSIEPGGADIRVLIQRLNVFATARITYAEMAAAFAKSVRTGIATKSQANHSLVIFQNDWANIYRIEVNELVVNQAAIWAWDFGLRGYDAVHLSAAFSWQLVLGETVTMATFDKALWTTAKQVGLAVYPVDLPALLTTW